MRFPTFTPYRLYDDSWNSEVTMNFKIRKIFEETTEGEKVAKTPVEDQVLVTFNISVDYFFTFRPFKM